MTTDRSPLLSLAFAATTALAAAALSVAPGSIAAARADSPGASAPDAGSPAADVAVGKPAPVFDVKTAGGAALNLASLKGKYVVLYFYPKDETPGCTKEACAFRDAWNELSKRGVVLIGVSADSDESHRKFAEHHKLPFHLVADEKGTLARLYGVPPFGRQSFVVAKDGTIKKIYRSVDVTKHAQEILEDTK